MIPRRILASLTVTSVAAAALLFGANPVRGSDHQDTYNLATRANTSADITDVYIFPASNSANVVFVMNVSPLTPPGASPSFDPTLMWQFKISHGAKAGAEDQVIQFGATGTGTGQTITMYGPAAPNQVSTSNTFVAPAGSFNYNTPTQLNNGVKVFAGPRADPFFFDLFGFFTFLGDRHYATHSSENDGYVGGAGPGNALANGDNVGAAAKFAPDYDKTANPGNPSFNGFPAGTASGLGYNCRTNPSMNALADIGGGFNVLTYVVEVPRALLTTGFSSPVIHVWATVNSSTGS
ncbi:MAG: DUF4331 domain-containing protein [Candidatus Eremiobacteraeota bacterium]|nr:DUF4331 domain-containing protein [Candidatus Eremiobacteraeota bacterium]